MAKAIDIIEKLIAKKNSQTVAKIGLVGHSHMDTAWLWEIDETIKKCARTFANQISLIKNVITAIRNTELCNCKITRINLNYFKCKRQTTKKLPTQV